MKNQSRFLLFAFCVVTISSVSPLFAQNNSAGSAVSSAQNPVEILAGEIVQLRKSLSNVNTRLRDLNEKLGATDFKQTIQAIEKQRAVINNLEILSRAEQRAEILRKQFIELVEKENSLKARLAQVEEDARPENVERTLNVLGSTRAPELRETRRKTLENERSGLRTLIYQIEQTHQRLEDDVKQADLLVFRLRQQVLPAIEKEIQNLNPK